MILQFIQEQLYSYYYYNQGDVLINDLAF